MADFGLPKSQKKNRKPQTKTHHTKTTNLREADTLKKFTLPAIATVMAGFFIVGIFSSGQANSALNESQTTTTSDLSATTLSNESALEAERSSSDNNAESNSAISETSSTSLEQASSSSVRINISISSSSSSIDGSQSSEISDVISKVNLNGEEISLPKNGTVRSDCRTDNTTTKTRIRVKNDNNAQININTPEGCND